MTVQGPGMWFEKLDLSEISATIQGWCALDRLREELQASDSPIEQIGLEWLGKSGKRWRPFLVVSLYRAFMEGGGWPPPPAIRKLALAVECIHKASLVYDDIQDGDDQRYGEPTVHFIHGIPVALTVSLYLLGQGYRLIAEGGGKAEDRAEMLRLAAVGHRDLCLGQGRELLWMRHPTPLTSAEVLDIFRWKTAPSFEVVIRLPAVCAGLDGQAHQALGAFGLALGTAFQIQDDLKDFDGREDVDDIRARRPSIVMALALESAPAGRRVLIEDAWCGTPTRDLRAELDLVIKEVGAVEKAREALKKYKRSAIDALRPLPSMALRVFLCRLAEKILPEA